MSDIKVGDIVRATDLPAGARWRNVANLVCDGIPIVKDRDVLVVSLPVPPQEQLVEHIRRLEDATRYSAGWIKGILKIASYLRDNPEVLDLLDEVDR